MAFQFVQGRTNNHLTWVGVDATDFASRESALSAAWKIKIYGTLETAAGVNFVSSGTGSLTNDIVHVGASLPGVYHIALAKADLSDASAAWYDEYIVILSATGAAYETFIIEGVRTDTSALSNFLSNLSAIASDIYSALTITNSRALLIQSTASDAASGVSDLRSLLVTTGVALTVSAMSDIASQVWAHAIGTRVDSRILVAQSFLSDIRSNVLTTPSAVWATALATKLVQLNTSDLSDLRSAIAGVTATLSVSDISDIASAVWANTIGARVDSRLLLNQSRISDTYSLLSDFYSDFQSRVPKRVATDSQLSDLASDLRSYLAGMSGMLSDTYSLLSDTQSDMLSLLTTTGVQLNASSLSDLRSAITGVTLTLSASDLSDITSAVRATMVSDLSDILSAARQFADTFIVQQGSLTSTVAGSAFMRIGGITHNSQLNGYYFRVRGGSQADEFRIIWDTTASTSRIWVKPDFKSQLVAGTDYQILLGNPYFGVLVSDISDIASAVWAATIATHGVTPGRMGSLVRAVNSGVSDIYSALTAGTFTLGASNASDIASAVWAHATGTRVDSRVLLNLSRISDVYSLLSDTQSDLVSLLTTTGVQLNASSFSDLRSAIAGVTATVSVSDISDIASAVWATALATKLVQLNPSDLSDLRSAIAAVTAAVSASDMSDIASRVWATAIGARVDSRIVLLQSTASDAASGVSDLRSLLVTTGIVLDASTMSDLRSAITAGAGAVTVSNISDIASAVWSFHWTGNSLASSFGSAFEKLLSGASDAASAAQQVNSRVALLQGASYLSDIASQVWAHTTGLRVDSRLLVAQSTLSDLYSQMLALSDAVSDLNSDLRSLLTTTGVQLNTSTMSDLRSAVAAVTVNLTVSDISDIASAVAAAVTTITASDISDIASAVRAALVSDLSDILSAAVQGNSRALVNQSRISDVYSLLSDVQSDFQSRVPKRVATDSQLSDLVSDLRSYLVVMSGVLSDVYSLASDLNSDLRSVLTTTGVQLNVSSLSDLRSAIAGVVATLGASDISDIASAVRAALVSDLSDIYSAAQQANSRALVIQSSVSDLTSAVSDLNSDLRSLVTTTGVQLNASSLSDIRSAITAAAVTLDASTMSDIASQVWAHLVGVRVDSRVLLNLSRISDVYSLLSDVGSDLRSYLGVMSGVQSDIYSLLSDFQSDMTSRFPATIPELTGDPGATPTQAQATALQYMWLKNNGKSNSTRRMLRNDAGVTVLSGLHAETANVSYVQGRLG